MSTETQTKRKTINDIRNRKGGEPIVVLTAYSTPMAQLLDDTVDMFIVGDSVGMVLYGMDSTLGVSMNMMINHGKAVMRGSSKACVVVDMPFASYQESPQHAYRNAAKIMRETGCSAVKLEGGCEMAATIDFLVRRGIPVMGHVGLKPQSVHGDGGYHAHGRDEVEAELVRDDAKAVAQAGAFSMVIEGTIEAVAKEVSEIVAIPTIGIGASAACDGQVLVTEDMVGLFNDFTPKFVKRYVDLGAGVQAAAQSYAKDVKARTFPGPEHCFTLGKDLGKGK